MPVATLLCISSLLWFLIPGNGCINSSVLSFLRVSRLHCPALKELSFSSLSGFAALLCGKGGGTPSAERSFLFGFGMGFEQVGGVHYPAHSLKTHVFCIIACTGLYTLQGVPYRQLLSP